MITALTKHGNSVDLFIVLCLEIFRFKKNGNEQKAYQAAESTEADRNHKTATETKTSNGSSDCSC